MKKSKLVFRFLIFNFAFLIFYCASSAQAQVRAVWVRPFINADVETRQNAATGRAFIRAELMRIKRANLNTVYVEAFWDGYTIYPTSVAAQRPLSIDYGTARNGEGWDVLKTYLDEGARLDLKIHAWLHVFHQWNTNLGGLENSPIFSKHRDWAILDKTNSPIVKSEAEGANRDIYKVFLSPSNTDARRYLFAVVAELAEKYPNLSGVQWDYIRYPLQTSQAFDFNSLALARFKRETGIDAGKIAANSREAKIWQDWKTRQVTETVAELAKIIRRKRPEWEISAAVFPDIEQNLQVKQQDWKDWAEKKLIDALLPMLYSTDFKKVETWAQDFRRDVPAKTRVYPALFVGHFYNAKQNKFDRRYLDLQTKFRFDGVGLFAAQSLTDDLIEKLTTDEHK